MRLAGRFYDSPGVIPPAAVVVCFFRTEDFGRGLGILAFGVDGAECQDAIADLELIVKDGLPTTIRVADLVWRPRNT